MNKITIVLGLGISGMAAAEFLLQDQVPVVGIDSNRALLNSAEICRLQAQGLAVRHDSVPIAWEQVGRLIVSPGISPQHPIYARASKEHIPIVGEAELALPRLNAVLVAVTGTNGKTTVVQMVEHILNAAGIKAKALGNIGIPLCGYLLNPGDEDVLIVELSSFQLETMRTPVFDAAVLLNVTPDHLDRYPDMRAYAEAKFQLQHLMKEGSIFWVQTRTAREYCDLLQTKQYRTFGLEEGSDLWSDRQILKLREKVECFLPLDYREKGMHDCENLLAAWGLCQRFSVSSSAFCEALTTFRKPPHRIEFVRAIDGVSYFDDSKGTNIDAVVQAVNAMRGPVILIAGGVDKGASYLLWKERFASKVKQIIAIGQAAPKIYAELHPYFNVKFADTLDAAVKLAARDAERGDCVLLSPGCSSFDMFRDYAHRGEEFQRCVSVFAK